MRQNNSGTPIIRIAVQAVLTASTAVASLGVADAQEASSAAPAPSGSEPAATEVVVTGSRLVIPNQVSISPVTTVTADTIQATGLTRVEDLLNQLPQVYAGQSSTVVNGADGTAQVDLRSLGAQRTLVLVNGLRLGPGDPRSGGASDLNMIPTALIENVELLTGGASSTYGADAVAGVVNFKLNDHYEGVKLTVTGSMYDHTNTDTDGVITALHDFNSSTGNSFAQAPGHIDDGATEQISFIAGLNSGDGKGNATFYATYRKVQPVLQSNYSVSECSLLGGYATSSGYGTHKGAYQCGGSGTSYPGLFISPNDPIPAGRTSDPGYTLGPSGTLIPYTNANAYNYGPLNYFERPDENYTAGAFLHYAFNEHVDVYANTMFMDDRTLAQIAPSGAFLQSYTVNCNNPYLTSPEVNQWCLGSTAGSTSLLIGRRDVEGGNRIDDLQHTDFREVIGAKGAIDSNWTYDASFQYAQVNLQETYYNDNSVQKIGYALDAVPNPATNGVGGVAVGSPVCAVTLSDAQGSITPTGAAKGCIPWNIFNIGGVTSQQAQYLDTPGVDRGQVKQYVVNVNFSGDLSKYGLQLPTAKSGVLMNVGAEYRDVHDFTIPDEEFQSGDLAGQGGPILPVEGTIVSREGFFETHVPLIDDRPFAKSLALDAGYRYSAYGTSDSSFETNTYKVGAEWSPTSDYRVRGSFTRAVRAPNISELFGADSISLDGGADFCSGDHPRLTMAQCVTEGVPASAYGKIIPNTANQYNGLTGGNTQLSPETAITSSFGIGWTPSYVPNLRVQVDYYDIKIEGVIGSVGYSTIQSVCATTGEYCVGTADNRFFRSAAPNYSLWLNEGYILDTLANIGQLEQKGVDVDASYAVSFGPWGKLSANLNGTYVNKFEIVPDSALPGTAYNCEGYYGFTCGGPTFKWRHTLRLDWATPWSVNFGAAWRYYSPVTVDSLNPNVNLFAGPNAVASGAIPQNGDHIASFSYLDLTASWRVNENLNLRLGVNNVFDRDPPVIGGSSGGSNGNTYPEFYDALGRYLFVEATLTF